MCNKNANGQHDLRLCCLHRLYDVFSHDWAGRKITIFLKRKLKDIFNLL